MSVSRSSGDGDVEGDVVGAGDTGNAAVDVETGARIWDVEDVDDLPEQALSSSEPAKALVMIFSQTGGLMMTSRPAWLLGSRRFAPGPEIIGLFDRSEGTA
jgi:hypothetical protein